MYLYNPAKKAHEISKSPDPTISPTLTPIFIRPKLSCIPSPKNLVPRGCALGSDNNVPHGHHARRRRPALPASGGDGSSHEERRPEAAWRCGGGGSRGGRGGLRRSSSGAGGQRPGGHEEIVFPLRASHLGEKRKKTVVAQMLAHTSWSDGEGTVKTPFRTYTAVPLSRTKQSNSR